MNPTYRTGDVLSYGRVQPGKLHRFAVIVFIGPEGWTMPNRALAPNTYIKRIIGLPGDQIECCAADGKLTINGFPVDESVFLAPAVSCDGPMRQGRGKDAHGGCNGWSARVPAGHYFVMGDNRASSADSSYYLCPEGAATSSSRAADCVDAFIGTADIIGVVQ